MYLNLKFLTEKGMIQEVNIKKVLRFEPNCTLHHHIIYKKCGKIIDSDSKESAEYSLHIGKKIRELEIDATNKIFYATCKICKSFEKLPKTSIFFAHMFNICVIKFICGPLLSIFEEILYLKGD